MCALLLLIKKLSINIGIFLKLPDQIGIFTKDLVLARRVCGHHLDTHYALKNHSSGHPNFFVMNFLKCQFHKYKRFLHLNIIP